MIGKSMDAGGDGSLSTLTAWGKLISNLMLARSRCGCERGGCLGVAQVVLSFPGREARRGP